MGETERELQGLGSVGAFLRKLVAQHVQATDNLASILESSSSWNEILVAMEASMQPPTFLSERSIQSLVPTAPIQFEQAGRVSISSDFFSSGILHRPGFFEGVGQPDTPTGLDLCSTSLPLESNAAGRSRKERRMRTLSAPTDAKESWPMNIRRRQDTVRSSRTTSCGRSPSREVRQGLNPREGLGSERRWSLVVAPQAPIRVLMDILSVLVLSFDLATAPYLLSWDATFGKATFAVAIGFAIFWSLDMMLTSVTGFYDDGKLVTQTTAIMLKYVRTWFPLEALLLVLEWLQVAVMASAEDEQYDTHNAAMSWRGMLRLTKVFRFMRLFAMLRMLRAVGRLEDVLERFLPSHVVSQTFRGVLMLMKVAGSLLCVTHLMACVWYAVGVQEVTDTGRSWTQARHLSELAGSSMAFEYLVCFHWALVNFVSGATDIIPTNSAELAMAICAQLCGLAIQCSAVALISSAIIDVSLRQQHAKEELRLVGRFLRERQVTPLLCTLVKKAVTRRQVVGPLELQEVQLLQNLPQHLRELLQHEISWPSLQHHGLLLVWFRADDQLVKELCDEAVSLRSLHQDHEVFKSGIEVNVAFALVSGKLTYEHSFGEGAKTSGGDSSTQLSIEVISTEDTSFLCEAALWCHWTTVGRATAVTLTTEFLSIDADILLSMSRTNSDLASITEAYGRAYHVRVVNAVPPREAWPSDLGVPGTSFPELAVVMGSDDQLFLGALALRHAAILGLGARRHSTSRIGFLGVHERQLLDEVEKGECAIVETSPGCVQRTVSVMAIDLRAEFGGNSLMFMEIAKISDSQLAVIEEANFHCGAEFVQAVCKKPGVRQHAGEPWREALDRLEQKLGPLASHLNFQGTMHELEVVEKRWQNVPTLYVRNILQARVASTFDWNLLRRVKADDIQRALCSQSDENSPAHGVRSVGNAFGRVKSIFGSRHTWDSDVFLVQSDSMIRLWCWLDPDDYAFWSSSAGREQVIAILPSMLKAAASQSGRIQDEHRGDVGASHQPMSGNTGFGEGVTEELSPEDFAPTPYTPRSTCGISPRSFSGRSGHSPHSRPT